MAQFKVLKGPSSRIDQSVTAFHDGYAYFTPDDAGFYIDSEDDGEQRRIRINPIYTADTEAAQVAIAIDNEAHEISAGIVAGSIGTAELTDASVSKGKLSAELVAELEAEITADEVDAICGQTVYLASEVEF